MPLQLPNLDDRNYADLVEEARGLIPNYAPEWTNHNASDPGITLVELFAYLSELLIYRLNRVTAANYLSFLKLLNGPNWRPFGKLPEELSPAEILQSIPATILNLRKLERAVTPRDFEILALEADSRVARARCLPRLNIDVDMEKEKAGHVSVIILPLQPNDPNLPGLITAVESYLRPKLLLTTRLHVAGPRFLNIRITVGVRSLPDQIKKTVVDRVIEAVKKFFHPLDGGEAGKGWPFGRNVFISEIYSLIDQLPEIDFVEDVTLSPIPGRQITNTNGKVIGLDVKPYELVGVRDQDITVNA